MKVMNKLGLSHARQSKRFREALCATDDDLYWGSGVDGKGGNCLGIIWMNVRCILKSEIENTKENATNREESNVELESLSGIYAE